jgi:NADH-quinone oxidoreductase subunit H
VILFLGGWQFPWIATAESVYMGSWLVKLLVLAAKVAMVISFIMMIRWTIPRFRFDQLMGLAWKVLIPLTLANLISVMFIKQFNLSPWWLTATSLGLFVAAGMISVYAARSDISRRPSAAQLAATAT